MLINKFWKIEADSLNITVLKSEKNKKTGDTRWRPVAYFSSYFNALDFLVDQEVRSTELKDFRVVCEKQRELEALIRTLQVPPEMARAVRKPSNNETPTPRRSRKTLSVAKEAVTA